MNLPAKYKIIRVSNYDDEGPSGDQYFVLNYLVSEELASKICKLLNESSDRADDDYFRVVAWDYKLQEFQP